MDDAREHGAHAGSASNRRGFPRVSLTEAVKIELPEQRNSEARYGTTTNISRGGLIARVEGAVEANVRCVVRFLSSSRVRPNLVWGTVMGCEKEVPHHLVRIEFDTPLEYLKLTSARRKPTAGVDVLIADDESGVRETLRRYLVRSGYRTRVAMDGAEALQMIREKLPDVLLVDLYMPELNGLELLCRLKDLALQPRVILTISGEHDDTSARESLSLGAQDFLVKPIDFGYLEWAIKLRL